MNEEVMLSLRKEKTELKKNWSSKFILELDLIIEKCFLKNKTKKEHLVTKERIELDLIKLLQSQKRFTPNDKKFNANVLAVFDPEELLIGKIKKINFEDGQVDFININNVNKTKKISEVAFFDIYSVEMQVMFEKQSKIHDSHSFKNAFMFLTHKEKSEGYYEEEKPTKARYGILCKDEEKTRLTIKLDCRDVHDY